MLSMLDDAIPLLLVFPITDTFAVELLAGVICKLRLAIGIVSFEMSLSADASSALLLVALSEFPGESLSDDDSDDSCRRCIIRLDNFLSMSDAGTLPSTDTLPTNFYKWF